MRTEDLITALSADTKVAPPLAPLAVSGVAASLVVVFGTLVVTLGLRADTQAMLAPLVAFKTGLPIFLGLVALVLALRRVRPAVADGALPWALWGGLGALVLAMVAVLVLTEPQTWDMQMRGKTLWACLATIPALSVLPLGALMVILRQGAALRPTSAGFAAGLAAGSLSAAVYSLHCIEDSPLFYGLWYSAAILVVAIVGAGVGRAVLRW